MEKTVSERHVENLARVRAKADGAFWDVLPDDARERYIREARVFIASYYYCREAGL